MKINHDKIKLVKEWLMYAGENLLFAKAGMKEDFAPYNTICFLCQGSTEKYIKGYLISKGWELKKIHDVVDLVEAAIDYDNDFSQLLSSAKILNEYITEGRYPGDLAFESFTKKEAEEAIEAAEKIERFVMKKMQSFLQPDEDDADNE